MIPLMYHACSKANMQIPHAPTRQPSKHIKPLHIIYPLKHKISPHFLLLHHPPFLTNLQAHLPAVPSDYSGNLSTEKTRDKGKAN